MAIRHLKHNLLSLAWLGQFDVIVQGCNCFNRQASGIAGQIARAIPKAVEADNLTKRGDVNKLGHHTLAIVPFGLSPKLIVVNAYTQYYYATHPQYRGGELFSQIALDSVLADLKVMFHGKRFGFPRLGSGLAKGDPVVIEGLLEKHLGDEDVTLVDYDPRVRFPPVDDPPDAPW